MPVNEALLAENGIDSIIPKVFLMRWSCASYKRWYSDFDYAIAVCQIETKVHQHFYFRHVHLAKASTLRNEGIATIV